MAVLLLLVGLWWLGACAPSTAVTDTRQTYYATSLAGDDQIANDERPDPEAEKDLKE